MITPTARSLFSRFLTSLVAIVAVSAIFAFKTMDAEARQATEQEADHAAAQHAALN